MLLCAASVTPTEEDPRIETFQYLHTCYATRKFIDNKQLWLSFLVRAVVWWSLQSVAGWHRAWCCACVDSELLCSYWECGREFAVHRIACMLLTGCRLHRARLALWGRVSQAALSVNFIWVDGGECVYFYHIEAAVESMMVSLSFCFSPPPLSLSLSPSLLSGGLNLCPEKGRIYRHQP